MKRQRLLLAVLAATLAAPAGVASAASPGAGGGLTGRLLVTLAPHGKHAHVSEVSAIASAAGARLAGASVPQIGLVTVRPGAGRTPREAALLLRANPRVARVQVEHRALLRALPNDPALTAPALVPGLAPGTTEQWWAALAGFDGAWDQVRGDGALVAIIDTGIDATHPDLSAQIAGTLTAPGAGGPATSDDVGHGTHVASLACAASDNGFGIAGAGNGCRLLIARSDFSDSSIAEAIVWAADRGARAIGMSFGTDDSGPAPQAIVDALQYAARHGAVPVAAAADSPVEQQGYPADVLQPTGSGPLPDSNLGLTVTASTITGVAASFAGRGTQISLAAPGTTLPDLPSAGLLGAFPSAPTTLEAGTFDALAGQPCGCRTTFGGDPRWAYLQGTSMAVPLVAAAAALVRTVNPALSSAEVVGLLKRTARRSGGWTPDLGWGVLDAAAAVRAAGDIDRTPPRTQLAVTASSVRHSALLRWSSDDPPQAGVTTSGVALVEVWRRVGSAGAHRIATLPASRHTLRVRLHRGVRYRFFTVAVDLAGNRERSKLSPSVRLR